LLLITAGLFLRFRYFDTEGGDHRTYKKAVNTFISGENPYKYTVESFEKVELKKGYAYLPTLLYVQTFFVKMNQLFNGDWATKHMWKLPVMLADLMIVLVFAKKYYKKDFLFLCFITAFWLFNPHILARKEYVLYDPFAVLFLLLSFMTIENDKKSWLSGLYFAIAVSFKTFPIILLPIFLLKSKRKIAFLISGALLALIISIPFLDDLQTYIRATLLVHGDREVQGRPILTFLSFYGYNIGINFYQTLFHKIYAKLAILLPWVAGIFLYFRNKKHTVFQLSLIPIGLYYLVTPVLNRTHVLWFIPMVLIGLYDVFKDKKVYMYMLASTIYIFLFGYLAIWNRGYKIYECSMVSITPSEKASTRICDKFDVFGISHCSKKFGTCLPHCCSK